MFKKKSLILASALVIGAVTSSTAQQGQVSIIQDEAIPELLEKKTEMVKDGIIGDRYRIQLFSGDNNQASKVIKDYRSQYPDWPSTIVFETPNYKVWVGNFRNSLEADRALLEIKKTFPSAFRFKPEKR
ncbi:Sporulation related domain-containing protein [Salinimicrobium sediminis]|uniref:Sporulation related domain-containing protein n=1 Tax=Salinimicrobium sediminis TaxID=1343891 RepID=A0A285X0T8_9FLAO|nr:SPOR domain-containing protein [Salinimicrobium sediminis]SOC78981.1 Sporulation related domain-containing protein [Salinimicrobium sediminis]